MIENKPKESSPNWQKKSYQIIFEAETPAGKFFDVILLWAILISVVVVMLESIAEVKAQYGSLLLNLEWFFTILFSIEYIFRILSVAKSRHYIFSFYGIVDFLATIPTYVTFIFPGVHLLLVIRILRLLRVFRIFKLTKFITQAAILTKALKASRVKIAVFLMTVLSIVVIIGSIIYVIEGPENGFTSIPSSIYWAIVTLTTVGYGDMAPQTPLGQFLASIVMITGYAIIAVPTGIVTVELADASRKSKEIIRLCSSCRNADNENDALYCKKCGTKL